MSEIPSQEGFIPVTGGRVWYRIVGTGSGQPLLILHGGPGIPHDYLESLDALANERLVIYYDQLGCGKSDRPDNVTFWQIERFTEELYQVHQALGLDQFHLLGHSWGSILATECAIGHSKNIVSLILASPYLNFPYWFKTILPKLITELPADTQAVLANNDASDSPEYQKAVDEYNSRHLCLLNPLPDALLRAIAGTNWEIRHILFGIDEFRPDGPLTHYDCTQSLSKIDIPVLLTCGRYDDCTPEYLEWHHRHLVNSEMVVFEHSAHMAPLEEPELYIQTIRDFWGRVEK
jgi:proline iminopeptidase